MKPWPFTWICVILLVASTAWAKEKQAIPKKCVPLQRAELDYLTKAFESSPRRLLYTEEQEYLAVTPLGVNTYFLLKYRKLTEGDSVLHQKYLGGRVVKGHAAGGGIRVFSFKPPFLRSEVKHYRFCKHPGNVVFFYPVDRLKEGNVGRLLLENGIPKSMEMTPVFRFPQMDYALKKSWFEVKGRRLVEVFTEVSGRVRTLPFWSKRVVYRVRRTDIEWKNPQWRNKP